MYSCLFHGWNQYFVSGGDLRSGPTFGYRLREVIYLVLQVAAKVLNLDLGLRASISFWSVKMSAKNAETDLDAGVLNNSEWVKRRLDEWEVGDTAFHQGAHDPLFDTHGVMMFEGGAKSVFAPLCGKSFDLIWMYNRGHTVVGAEIAEQAVQELFSENKLDVHVQHVEGVGPLYKSTDGRLQVYVGDLFDLTKWGVGDTAFHQGAHDPLFDTHGDMMFEGGANRAGGPGTVLKIKLDVQVQYVEGVGRLYKSTDGRLQVYVGDLFDLTKDRLGEFDRVWDSKSIVAINVVDQERYRDLLLSFLKKDGQYYLMIIDYDPAVWPGPPHNITDQRVRQLYGEYCNIEVIQESNLTGISNPDNKASGGHAPPAEPNSVVGTATSVVDHQTVNAEFVSSLPPLGPATSVVDRQTVNAEFVSSLPPLGSATSVVDRQTVNAEFVSSLPPLGPATSVVDRQTVNAEFVSSLSPLSFGPATSVVDRQSANTEFVSSLPPLGPATSVVDRQSANAEFVSSLPPLSVGPATSVVDRQSVNAEFVSSLPPLSVGPATSVVDRQSVNAEFVSSLPPLSVGAATSVVDRQTVNAEFVSSLPPLSVGSATSVGDLQTVNAEFVSSLPPLSVGPATSVVDRQTANAEFVSSLPPLSVGAATSVVDRQTVNAEFVSSLPPLSVGAATSVVDRQTVNAEFVSSLPPLSVGAATSVVGHQTVNAEFVSSLPPLSVGAATSVVDRQTVNAEFVSSQPPLSAILVNGVFGHFC
ncbi:hypothetical protein DPMN_040025 [Dreissena polymorpha]|uniref:Thiopurine S-methyltransferase n=1 Tax=Dreissena polymorpha TaxID=45954 RepID=A0A9D4CWY7_DREPO|nr:hypothetical protein DPMN_040025 [Dreissena polymorpha]